MTTQEQIATETVHIQQVFIKASQQAIWDAITQPEWTQRYGPAIRAEYESLRPGGAYRAFANEAMKAYSRENGWPEPDVMFEGEVIEADPPRRLVQTWHPVFDEETSAEPATRLTLRDRGVAGRNLPPDAHARRDRRPGGRSPHRWRGARDRRRLGLRPQRPQDPARDRERDGRVASRLATRRRDDDRYTERQVSALADPKQQHDEETA